MIKTDQENVGEQERDRPQQRAQAPQKKTGVHHVTACPVGRKRLFDFLSCEAHLAFSDQLIFFI